MTRSIVFIVALLCVGCGPSSRQLPAPGWIEHGAILQHDSSGLRFPAVFKGLVRDHLQIYEPTGRNASVEYRRDKPLLRVTVYIYPREHGEADPADEFRAVITAILQNPEGKLYDSWNISLPGGIPGYAGFAEWREGKAIIGSWALLTFTEGWFLKVRASHPFVNSGEPIKEAFDVGGDLLVDLREDLVRNSTLNDAEHQAARDALKDARP